MCQCIHRDVGFVEMSNSLRRLGKLDDAVKATRAALAINFDEVCICVDMCACALVHVCKVNCSLFPKLD